MKEINLFNHIGIFNFGGYNLFEDGDLEIAIFGNNVKNSTIEILADNGLEQRRFACKDNIMVIPKDFVRVGVLKIKINVLLNGRVVKVYTCEDLIVIKDEEEFKAIPEMVVLRNENREIKAKLDEVLKSVDKLTTLVSQLYGINVEVE